MYPVLKCGWRPTTLRDCVNFKRDFVNFKRDCFNFRRDCVTFRRVSGACRNEVTRERLTEAGVEAHKWDPVEGVLLDQSGLDSLATASHVLTVVPPVGDDDEDPVRHSPHTPPPG